MTPDPTDDRLASDLAMMRDAGEWPLWPRLPVKKLPLSQPRSTGFVTEERGTKEARPVVYNNDGDEIARYDTLEELVADGWIVD